MAITLTHDATTINLGDRLVWSDEHAWQAPQMELDRGTLGDLHVHVRARTSGRPITLEGVDSNAWIDRTTVLALQSWAQLPGVQFLLHLRGGDWPVMFDHTRAPAFDARPIWLRLADSEFADQTLVHLPTLRFIAIGV
jgi:hypothetical protein